MESNKMGPILLAVAISYLGGPILENFFPKDLTPNKRVEVVVRPDDNHDYVQRLPLVAREEDTEFHKSLPVFLQKIEG